MYIILQDTQGSGLTTFGCCGLNIFSEEELPKAILNATLEYIGSGRDIESELDFDDDEIDFVSEMIVVLPILDNHKDELMSDYISKLLKNEIKTKHDEDYEKYLKLKEKFEKKGVKK